MIKSIIGVIYVKKDNNTISLFLPLTYLHLQFEPRTNTLIYRVGGKHVDEKLFKPVSGFSINRELLVLSRNVGL